MQITKTVDIAVTTKAVLRDGVLKVDIGIGVPYGTEGKQRSSHHHEEITDAPELEVIRTALATLAERETKRLFPMAEQMATQSMSAACARREM